MTDSRLRACGNDAGTNPSSNPGFDTIIEARLSRRQMLCGTASTAALAILGGGVLERASAHGTDRRFGHQSRRLGFTAVPKSLDDVVTVPAGYRHDVLYALGDPIAPNVSDYHNDGTDDPASFAHRAGDHHDGIQYFGLGSFGRPNPSSSDHGLLCMNHEAITRPSCTRLGRRSSTACVQSPRRCCASSSCTASVSSRS